MPRTPATTGPTTGPGLSALTTLTALAATLLHAPPVEWQDRAETVSNSEREAAAVALEALAERAVRVAAYLHARTLGARHENAVRAQNTAGAVVRRLFGYTDPNAADVTF